MNLAKLGYKAQKKKQHGRAEELFKAHLREHPDDVGCASMLATLFLETKRPGLALDMYEASLSANPDMDHCYVNLIVACKNLGYVDKGLECAERAVERFGKSWYEQHLAGGNMEVAANTLSNLGNMYLEMGRPEEAEEALNLALKYRPDHLDAKWNRGLARLVRKDWRGFQDYEYGFKCGERQLKQYFDEYPDWHGKNPEGKTILVWGEQGLGDEILFAQCLKDLHDSGAEVIFDCHPRLQGIFQRSFPFECTGKRKDKTPGIYDDRKIDGQVPIGSLPLYFRKKDEDFLKSGFLTPDREWVQYWAERLPKNRTIGLSWRGGAYRNARDRRSLPLEALARQVVLPFRDADINWVSLQYGEGAAEEVNAFNRIHGTDIRHFPGAMEDYSQTADLVATCDLVVSVITAVVHLAGAMDIPVWCAVPVGAPWKFTHDETMIWHPSVRMYRQDAHYVWEPVLERMKNDLAGWMQEKAA